MSKFVEFKMKQNGTNWKKVNRDKSFKGFCLESQKYEVNWRRNCIKGGLFEEMWEKGEIIVCLCDNGSDP